MPITQQITDIPTPPSSTDKANFRTRADNFLASLDNLADELNNFKDQANALEDNVNQKEQSANDAAMTAMASANFKGTWDVNTSYTHPCSVVKNGVYYTCLQDSTGQDPETTTGYWEVLKDQNNTVHANGSGKPNELATVNAGYTFKVADAVNPDEALSKGQLLAEIQEIDGSGSGLDADLLRGLPADFTSSKSTSGYQKLPSGLIIQWFKFTSSIAGHEDVSFPIAFPNACLSISAVTENSGYPDIQCVVDFSLTTGSTMNAAMCHTAQNQYLSGYNSLIIAIGY